MKVNRILLFFLILVCVVPMISFIGWVFEEKNQMEILVIDKTVPKFNVQEHRSLFWVLNHNKIVKKNNKRYRFKKDYFGFFPIKSKTSKEYRVKSIRLTAIDSLVESNDMLYCADAYGVFYSDWYSGLGEIENSTLIYGGFNQNDYYLLQKFKEQGKLIIAEYNLFGHPTNPLIRYKTQDLLGVKYTGWTGKYFKRLGEDVGEVPMWLINKYKRLYNKSWPFKNAGVILLNKDNIIVLEVDVHLQSSLPMLVSSSYFSAKFSLPETIPFTGWFEIVENGLENTEMAWFKLNTNNFGDEILKQYDLSNQIPAIISNYTQFNFVYFAGDFADNAVAIQTYPFKNILNIKEWFYSSDNDDKKRFFWEYYEPMMTGLIDEYKEQQTN